MKKLIMLVVLSLFVCGAAKVTTAGDICGYVYDINDKAISGVEISTKDDHTVYSEKTSGSGLYYLSLMMGSYTIKYKKEGYQTQTSEISLLKSDKKYLEMVIMIANPNPAN